MAQAVVYWRPRCPYCAALKLKLRVTGTPHVLVNIHEDSEAAGLVRAANGGDELVPTVRVGEAYLSNPTLRQVRAALATR